MNDASTPLHRVRSPAKLARAIGRRLPYAMPWLRTLARRVVGGTGEKRIWIHIGAHKTGTTSLQRLLAQERHALMAQDMWFDEASIDFGEIFAACSPLPAEEIERHRAELRARYEARRERVIILSSEFFFGDPERGYRNIGDAAVDLRKITEGFDAQIIACVRRQDEFIESWYHQHVKRGGTDTFAQFLDRVGADAFQWDTLLDGYARAFGADAMKVLVFEELRTDALPMIERFFGGLGHDFRLKHPRYREFNPSFSKKALQIALQSYPALDMTERKRLRDALLTALPRPKGEPFGLFSDESRATLMQLYADSNRRCFARYFGGDERGRASGYFE